MARIVELCGSPGVGKTTLYAEVLSRWEEKHNWIPGHYLYPLRKVRFSASIDYLLSLIQKIKRVPDAVAMKKAGELFVRQNPFYVDACWNNIFYRKRGGSGIADVRFHAAEYWFKIFQKIQVLQQSDSHKLALIDEGLIQRIDSALHKSKTWEEEKEEIIELLNIMVLPHALIYVQTDVKENVARLKKRKKVLTLHKNVSEEELEQQIRDYQRRWNFVCELLEKKEVHVLKVDSGKAVPTNASAILRFLEESHLNKFNTNKKVLSSMELD